eukprot:1161282-Pelagomonas_calceolata.AAC.16
MNQTARMKQENACQSKAYSSTCTRLMQVKTGQPVCSCQQTAWVAGWLVRSHHDVKEMTGLTVCVCLDAAADAMFCQIVARLPVLLREGDAHYPPGPAVWHHGGRRDAQHEHRMLARPWCHLPMGHWWVTHSYGEEVLSSLGPQVVEGGTHAVGVQTAGVLQDQSVTSLGVTGKDVVRKFGHSRRLQDQSDNYLLGGHWWDQSVLFSWATGGPADHVVTVWQLTGCAKRDHWQSLLPRKCLKRTCSGCVWLPEAEVAAISWLQARDMLSAPGSCLLLFQWWATPLYNCI